MKKARYRITECDVDEKEGYAVFTQDGAEIGYTELINTPEGNEVWFYVNGECLTLPLTKRQATKLCASLNKVKHVRCATCGDEHPETEMSFELQDDDSEIPFCCESCSDAFQLRRKAQ